MTRRLRVLLMHEIIFQAMMCILCRLCHSRYFFKRALCTWCDFIMSLPRENKMALVVFHLTQPPSCPERKRSQLTPIMKPKINFSPDAWKLHDKTCLTRGFLTWSQNSNRKTCNPLFDRIRSKATDFPDFPRILKFLTVFGPKSGLNVSYLNFETRSGILSPKHVWSCYF